MAVFGLGFGLPAYPPLGVAGIPGISTDNSTLWDEADESADTLWDEADDHAFSLWSD